MQFIADHWAAVFGGFGGAIMAAIIGAWATSYFEKNPEKTKDTARSTQRIESGAGSTNIQAGRDVDITSP